MKKILAIFTIFILAATGMLSGCLNKGQGTLVLNITDAPDLNITAALVTMSNVSVHYAGLNESSEFGEWVNVVNTSQTFDLVALQDAKALFGSAELKAGWYTQIRLEVEKAVVTIDGTQYNLTVPSDYVKLIRPFRIADGKTTNLTLDFDVNKSVVKTGNDQYKLKPTIKIIKE